MLMSFFNREPLIYKRLRLFSRLSLLLLCLCVFSIKTIAANNQPRFAVVAWSPDGNYIAEGRGLGILILRDALSGEILRNFHGAHGTVNSIGWSPDSSKILAGDDSAEVKVWNINGQILARMASRTSTVFDAQWSPDGTRIAMISASDDLNVWDTSTYRMLYQSRTFAYLTPRPPLQYLERGRKTHLEVPSPCNGEGI